MKLNLFKVTYYCLMITVVSLFGLNPAFNTIPSKDLNSAVADTSLARSWEGEYQATQRPYFMTLHLQYSEKGWNGSIEVLGQTHPLKKVEKTENGVRCVLVPGSDGITLEAELDNNKLTGFLSEGNNQYPLDLYPVPLYPEPGNREQAWYQDLEALTERFLKFDRSFTPSERNHFQERIGDLHDEISELNDSEIKVQMASAVALADNAHTRLYLLRNRTELRRLPIRLWWFSDGLYVVRTKSSHKSLLGCRVNEIEGMPIQKVRDKVSNAFAGNSSWVDYKSVYFMTSPEILQGFNITSDPENIAIRFSECKNRPFTYSVKPLDLNRSSDPVEAWWDLSPNHKLDGWVHVLKDKNISIPLYLRHPDRHYWFEYIEKENLLYFQYNRASEMDDESISDFSKKLLGEFEDKTIDKFVLDLRFNTGGSLNRAEDLMSKLQQRTINIPRFVITGRATFSAGITHVASWMEDGNIKIVGEPIGDELNFWAEGGNITLPNSNIAAHFANGFHSYSEEPCPKNVPCILDLNSPSFDVNIPAKMAWSEYTSGVDNALDTILYDLADN